jgi:hypothetical protein
LRRRARFRRRWASAPLFLLFLELLHLILLDNIHAVALTTNTTHDIVISSRWAQKPRAAESENQEGRRKNNHALSLGKIPREESKRKKRRKGNSMRNNSE